VLPPVNVCEATRMSRMIPATITATSLQPVSQVSPDARRCLEARSDRSHSRVVLRAVAVLAERDEVRVVVPAAVSYAFALVLG
jgi:hypothetical protein